MKKIFLLLFFYLNILSAQVSEYSLENGLKLIVNEDHRSQVVVSQVWYKAGSIDEVNGKTGVAHVLEHMMFKGTQTIKPGEFSEIIARVGGRENAFTGTDYTCYFQTLEQSNLELALKLEADRMQNLNLSKEEFNKEIKVVMEERRWRTDDKPEGMLNENFNALVFNSHPYGRPIVGWMSDLESMNYQDARDWYQDWYAPNNATVVISGDIDPKQAYKLVEKYFANIPKKILKERKPQIEAQQLGKRMIEVSAPSELVRLQMGYVVPTLNKLKPSNDRDAFALDVLANVLSGGPSSRLYKSLVKSGATVSALASYPLLSRGDKGTFEFLVAFKADQQKDEVQKIIQAEIQNILKNGVSNKELERVKAGAIAANVYEKDSMFYQGMIIGQLESMGYSYTIKDDYINQIKNVTSKDIQAVINKFFNDNNLNIAILNPKKV
ncbi:MAG: pitrilysin family protein [Nitrosomonadales bacterium]